MPITAINISQDNIVSGSNLMPVHSPLSFIAEATYNTTTPATLYARVYDINDLLIDTFKCIPYEDPIATVRTFLFDANLFLKSYMDSQEDVLQVNGSFLYMDAPTEQFKISFYDSDSLIESSKLTIDAIAGAAQFSEYPNLIDIYNNEAQTYISKIGGFVYVYFYNRLEGTNVQITDNGVFIGGYNCPDIGYYRYKTTALSKIVNFTTDGVVDVNHNIIAQGCTNDALVKYLDLTGQFRFFNFTEYYEINDNSRSIGSIEKLITNIRTDETNRTQIGKETTRQYLLSAEVPNTQLSYIDDILRSPLVYLYVGTLPTDTLSDWLQVEVLTNESIIKRRRNTTGKVNISLQLPEVYNVTLL